MQGNGNQSVGLGVKLPVASTREFLEKFGSSLSRGGIYLRSKRTLPPGTRVQLDLKLVDGSSLLCSPGRVEFITSGVCGMGIRFVDMPGEARRFVDEVTPKLPHGALELPPIPDGVGPVDRGQTTSLELVAASALLTSDLSSPPAPPKVSDREIAPPTPVIESSRPSQTPVTERVSAAPTPASSTTAFASAELATLSRELGRLRRSVRATWFSAVAFGVAAFFVGRAMSPLPAAAPVVLAAPTPVPVLTVDEQRALDMAPAFEDELTAEEKAQAEEIIAAAELPPPPPVVKKKPVVLAPVVKKKPAAAKKKVLVASSSGRAADVTKSSSKRLTDARADADAKLIADALSAGRGSKCKARFDEISEVVAKTRVAGHRAAGIVLRARCFADTWRSAEAKTEFGRYLREFPNGKYADEARRVLAN